MKTSDLSIKELAALMGVSIDTIVERLAGGHSLNPCGQSLSIRFTPGSAPDDTERRCLSTDEIGGLGCKGTARARTVTSPRCPGRRMWKAVCLLRHGQKHGQFSRFRRIFDVGDSLCA